MFKEVHVILLADKFVYVVIAACLLFKVVVKSDPLRDIVGVVNDKHNKNSMLLNPILLVCYLMMLLNQNY